MVNPHDTIQKNVESCLDQQMCVSDPLTDPNFCPDPKLLVENYLDTLFLTFNVVLKGYFFTNTS